MSSTFTLSELAQYNGVDPSKPIYLALKGVVYDVTEKRDAYQPGGSYHILAGKDASRALAVRSLKAEDCTSDLTGATDAPARGPGQLGQVLQRQVPKGRHCVRLISKF